MRESSVKEIEFAIMQPRKALYFLLFLSVQQNGKTMAINFKSTKAIGFWTIDHLRTNECNPSSFKLSHLPTPKLFLNIFFPVFC